MVVVLVPVDAVVFAVFVYLVAIFGVAVVILVVVVPLAGPYADIFVVGAVVAVVDIFLSSFPAVICIQ